MIQLPDILNAHARIAPFAEATPAVSCGEINAIVGAQVSLKLENLQGSGSFKLRGALSALTALAPGSLRRGAITASAGNHGLAVAHAAHLLDTSALVVLPNDAAPTVVEAVRALGGRVARYDPSRQCRDALTDWLAGEEGRTNIPAAGCAPVLAGAGTVAVELIRDVGPVDVLVVPVGSGGLAAGCAAAAATLAPRARVVGVAPPGRPSIADAVCDGQRGALTARLRDTVPVSDAEIVAAMRLLHDAVGLTVEPSGACALAALCAGRIALGRTDRVGVVVSGGNVAPDRFRRLLDGDRVVVA